MPGIQKNLRQIDDLNFKKLRSRPLEAISKTELWFKVKAGPSFNPQVPAGNALGVHTQVCRGFETRTQHRDWAKRLF